MGRLSVADRMRAQGLLPLKTKGAPAKGRVPTRPRRPSLEAPAHSAAHVLGKLVKVPRVRVNVVKSVWRRLILGFFGTPGGAICGTRSTLSGLGREGLSLDT